MALAQKKLVSTASRLASVSTSHLTKFPPKESFTKTGKRAADFSPDVWASLQPPPPSALSAFAHRIGLDSTLNTPELVQQACTHPSFLPLHSKYYPSEPQPLANEQLATAGNALLGLFATEHVHASYPHLPSRVLKAAVSAHVGVYTCASVAQEMGATTLLRWHRTPNTPVKPAVLHSDALASVPRAITALLYRNASFAAAKQFAQTFFLSREINLRSMIKFTDPKKALGETVAKFGRERPKSRLLKETGRFSNSPVFVVGIYSGQDKLGEGFGSSLRMAEFRAAEDSLHRLYLTRTPAELLQLPTSTFPSSLNPSSLSHTSATSSPSSEGTGADVQYTAPELAMAEIMYGASGRTASIAPKRYAPFEGES